MHPSPLLAFGFESLPMLGWLAAAAAPWLIHLLSRRKHRETAWAAMDFLLAAVKQRARRFQLEQLLLLLVRTLIIVAIVTAVAEPYFERVGPIFSPGGSTHRVLVIDASYSMGFKASDRSRFEQAKQWADQIVEHSLPGDGFTLVEMADPPRVVVSTPAIEAGPVREEIKNLELLDTGADVAATLAEVGKLLETARRDCPRLARHEVYIFSDMQRASWAPGTGAAANLRNRAAEVATIARLKLIDLGQPGDDNLAVTALDLRQPVVLAGQKVEIAATLRDFGHAPRPRQTVDLLVDGHAAGRQYLSVPAGGAATAQFQHSFTTPGEHAVEVRAPGDSLEVDNRRYLIVNVRPSIRVLCIDGHPSGDPTKASVYALSNALVARSDPDGRPPVEVDIAPASAVLERDLAPYDCVMFSDVAQFNASEGRLLENYLGNGGNLVFFLGDRVIAENYNAALADVPAPILPARLVEVAKNPGGKLDPRGYEHAIVQPFRGQEKVGLLSSPVEKYFKVSPLLPASAPAAHADLEKNPPQVAVALSNGDPLIVTRAVRHGRVVLVTTSADTAWSMLPTWGTYLPLVRQILDWCLAGQARPRNVAVGDALVSSLHGASALTSLTVEGPDGHRRSVPLTVQGDYSVWSYDDTRLSGIYSAQLGPPLSRTQLFAVNLNTGESDLAPISHDELQSHVLSGVSFEQQTAPQTSGAQLTLPEAGAAQLHVGLLYAVIVLLLVELVLAWKLGSNRR